MNVPSLLALTVSNGGKSVVSLAFPGKWPVLAVYLALFSLGLSDAAATTIGAYSKAKTSFYLQDLATADSTPEAVTIEGAQRTWLPVLGDWSGDGLFDYGLYDQASGSFHLRVGTGPGPITASFQFVGANRRWLPIAGDWDGDGLYGVGLYDPKTGSFQLKNSLVAGPADQAIRIDGTGRNWKPLTGDWNGDGLTTIGVYDPKTGEFHLRNSNSNGPADQTLKITGLKKSLAPIAADWNNDGLWTPGFYSSATQTFYWRNSPDTGPREGAARLTGIKSNYLPVAGISGSSSGGPGPSNHKPVFDSTCPTTASVGAAYSCTAHATDPDNDTLSYGISNSPAGMTIDPNTGVISWTPGTAGTVSFTLTVNDGKSGNVSRTVTVTVSETLDFSGKWSWSGESGINVKRTFSFVVENGVIISLVYEYGLTDSAGHSCSEYTTAYYNPHATISDGQFVVDNRHYHKLV